MPLYLDRHDLDGATAEDVAMAHIRDLEVQGRHGVRYLSYWFDYARQGAFCLVDAPSAQAAEDVHREAHGLIASRIIEVDPRQMDEFLGGIPQARPAEPYVATAFRAILFTDLEGSTALTDRLGDAAAMRVLRRHDEIVRGALRNAEGSEIKHTGDGIMASFVSAVRAVECAMSIQRQVAHHNEQQVELIAVRIGLSAGEPVTEEGDLFGAAVNVAARLCARASSGAILVSAVVRDLTVGKQLEFIDCGETSLAGFSEPVRTFEVAWR